MPKEGGPAYQLEEEEKRAEMHLYNTEHERDSLLKHPDLASFPENLTALMRRRRKKKYRKIFDA